MSAPTHDAPGSGLTTHPQEDRLWLCLHLLVCRSQSHFSSSSSHCCTLPVCMCVSACAVRAAFETLFLQHLQSLASESTRKDVCAHGGENKVKEACCIPAAQKKRFSAGPDTMENDECNFQGGMTLPLQSGHGSSHNRPGVRGCADLVEEFWI